MDEITIPFDPKRTPRELLTEALDNLPTVHCRVHQRERLEIDPEATLNDLVRYHRLVLRTEHEHCKGCPFVTRDRSAFDKWWHKQMASEGRKFDSFPGVESCAALCHSRWRELNFTALPAEARRPSTSRDADIDPNLRPDQQLDRCTHGLYASCAFGRSIGDGRSGTLPVLDSSVALRKLRHPWDEDADGNRVVTAYKVRPAVAPCPGCGVARCGVPLVVQHASFDNFTVDPPAIEAHLAKCRDYAANPRGFLLMLGSVGSGKTHLAVAIARARLSGGKTQFLNHDEFLLQYRKRYDGVRSSRNRSDDEDENPPDVLTETREAPLLIFDDLGRARHGRDEEDLLFSLFNHRYECRLPTIITSNLSCVVLQEFLGTALFDRMRQACFASLEFNFPSKRPGFNIDYLSH